MAQKTINDSNKNLSEDISGKKLIEPIAYIKSDFKEKFGIPRQSGLSPSSEAFIIFTPDFRDENALKAIEGFDYLWVIFDFSKARRDGFTPMVRPPRLGGNKRVGVFASRSPFRPNGLGLSSVKLIRVERNAEYGAYLRVGGADMLDGTPIYDVKPYVPYSDVHLNARGGYTEQAFSELEVCFLPTAEKVLPPDKLNTLKECLKQDPRPGYKHDKTTDCESFGMRFSDYDVKITISGKSLIVTEIIKTI